MPEGKDTAGRYQILDRIGRGGMGVVYLARHAELDRLVALKQLDIPGADPGDSAATERFLREARIAASLSHPNIVTVLDYFEEGGSAYIAMEYLERGSIRPLIEQLNPAQKIGILDGVLAGLTEAERAGIVHRDLKPENLLVSTQGTVKITDFGIAKALGQVTGPSLTATGMTLGSPAYMAPEQALSQEVGPWTDLYSTGVIAYELLVGRLPFPETDTPMAMLWKIVHDPVPPPLEVNPGLDPRLVEWLETLLAKEPSQRPQGADATRRWLDDIAGSTLGERWRRDAELPAGEARSRPTVAAPPGPIGAAERASARAATVAAPPGPIRAAEGTAAPAPSVIVEELPGRSRRVALIAGGVAALAVVAAGAFTILGRDGDGGGALEAGNPKTVDVGPGGALLGFHGRAGQRIFVHLSDVAIGDSSCCGAQVSIKGPDSTDVVAPFFVGPSGGFIDSTELLTAGAYTLAIEPNEGSSGKLTVGLTRVPPDVKRRSPIDGTPLTVTTTARGQNAEVRFHSDGNQRVFVDLRAVAIGDSTCCGAQVSIKGPDQTDVVAPFFVGTSGAFIDATKLRAAGDYTIVVDPQERATGRLTLAVTAVPPDVTRAVAADGRATTVKTTGPGQNAEVTFKARAGDRVFLVVRSVAVGDSSCCAALVSVVGPDGEDVVAPFNVGTSGGFVDATRLPAAGLYRVRVDPQERGVGEATLALKAVPPDVRVETRVGGPPVTVSTRAPGQNAEVAFRGRRGQRIVVRIASVAIGTSSCCAALVSVVDPNGEELIAPFNVGSSGGESAATRLSATGVYRLRIDAQDAGTGSVTIRIRRAR